MQKKIAKWSDRGEYFRKRVERAAHHDQTQTDRKRKAPDSPPEPDIQSYVAIRTKRSRQKNVYLEHVDGSAPMMNPLHVDFIRMSVDEIKKNEYIQIDDLLAKWNAAFSNGKKKRTQSIFANNYITLQLSRKISNGELPLPVPYDVWESGRVKIERSPRRGRPPIVGRM